MKKARFWLLLIGLSLSNVIGWAQNPRYVTLQKGGTYSMTPLTDSDGIVDQSLAPHLAFTKPRGSYNMTVIALSRGSGFAIDGSFGTVIFTVVDVVNIDIPEKVEIRLGEQYAYTPIVTDAEATTTLTWTSSNTSVANVDMNGVVTTVGLGKATITCTASNGVKAQSIVEVVPLLAQSVTLDMNTCELSVNETIQLQPTILPTNVTSTKVRWMSTNENIAQVDDNGNVTAIAPGYCSIYSIANDNSREFDKCLITVKGTAVSKADVNGDGRVSVTDAYSVIDVILNY